MGNHREQPRYRSRNFPWIIFLVTNNTAEYEAFLAGLRIIQDLGVRKVKIFTDSQLVDSQVTGDYQVREEHLQQYVHLVLEKMK